MDNLILSNTLRQLHQRPIAYYPCYADLCGNVTTAVALSQILYWWSYYGKKFYLSDEQLREETRLSERELRTAKSALKALSFLRITREGLPARTYYDIDAEKLIEAINAVPSSSVKTSKLDESKRPNWMSQNVQTIYKENETSSETSSEKDICASDAARPYSQPFCHFWETYPVKKGKGAAWKSWKRQKLDKQGETIVASVLAHQANDPDWKAGYIPHPATFLNGARWEDELPTPGHTPTNGVSEYAQHLDANGLLYHPDHPGHEFAARSGTRQVYCYTCNVDLGFALPAKE